MPPQFVVRVRSGTFRPGPPGGQAVTTVRVQNQNFSDANIYVLRGGVRSRLGTVTGNSTARFTIPATFVQSWVFPRPLLWRVQAKFAAIESVVSAVANSIAP